MNKPFKVDLILTERTFEFELYERELTLGPAGLIAYYWMDARQLRRGECENYRSCVDYWWACMAADGLTRCRHDQSKDIQEQIQANERTYALAELYAYPLIAASKGQHAFFRHSCLLPKRRDGRRLRRDSQSGEIPKEPDLHAQEQKLYKSRDGIAGVTAQNVSTLRREINELFADGQEPGNADPQLQEAYYQTMVRCVSRLHAGGQARLREYLETELLPVLRRGRKARGEPLVKEFINRLAYEAKVSFLTCYANAWVGLIPWLQEHRSLDAASEMLLRLWHNQTPRDTGQDVFWGQVPALHPVSAIMMESQSHSDALGRYVESVAAIDDERDIDDFNLTNPAYHALVKSIRVALHQYAQRREHNEEQRFRKEATNQAAVEEATRNDAPDDESTRFEKYAFEAMPACSNCGADSWKFVDKTVLSKSAGTWRAEFCCDGCKETTEVELSARDLLSDDSE